MDAVYHGVWNNFLHDYGKGEYAEHFLVNFGAWFADILQCWRSEGGGGAHSPDNFWEFKGLLSKTLTPFQTLGQSPGVLGSVTPRL